MNIILWLLKHINQVVGNLGWSIVIMAILVKIVFHKLATQSHCSIAALSKLQPNLNALKKRYGDNKQKLTQETMALYKANNVNPLRSLLYIVPTIYAISFSPILY